MSVCMFNCTYLLTEFCSLKHSNNVTADSDATATATAVDVDGVVI